MHRAHVDDAAAGPAAYMRCRHGARGQEGAVEMDRQHLLPLGEFELLERRDDLDAGVADQDVDAAEAS